MKGENAITDWRKKRGGARAVGQSSSWVPVPDFNVEAKRDIEETQAERDRLYCSRVGR